MPTPYPFSQTTIPTSNNNWAIAPQNYQQSYAQAQPSPMYPLTQPLRSQIITPSMIYGKFISSIEDVSAQDVVMDGSASIFPVRDGSAIYVKAWNPDGTITTFKYVPEVVNAEQVQENEIDSRINNIMQRLDRLENRMNSHNNPRKQNSGKNQEVNTNA